MYIWSDFAEENVKVKQYMRNGRLVRSYTAERDKKEPQQPRENIMQGSLGIPITLIGIFGLVGVLSLTGNKGVAKAVDDKIKVEKAIKVPEVLPKSPVLERLAPAIETPISKISDEMRELRSIYQEDKSKAMSSFYSGIDIQKPQDAKLKFAQMVSQKEVSTEEASKIIEGYEKATANGVASGTFKQRVVKKVSVLEKKYEKELIPLEDNLAKYKDPKFEGRKPTDDKIAYMESSVKKIKLQQNLVKYDIYGEEFAALGTGKTQMEQKQYLFLQEYLADDPKQFKEFKNYILGGSLIQADKGKPLGFSAVTPDAAVRNAFEYGYKAEDISIFNTLFGMNLSKKDFKGINNIYKKPKL